MAHDGRLDDEELDELLGAAGTPEPRDPAPTRLDELSAGPDRPGLGERLAPVRGWLGRHRALAAVVAAVVLVAAVGGGLLLSQPTLSATPPAGDAPTAALTSIVDDGPAPDDIGERLLTRLVLSPQPGQTVPTALGLYGAGLAGPQVVQVDELVTTSNTVECEAIPDLGAGFGPYVVRVVGDQGDPQHADLPLIGDGPARIWSALVQHCARTAADRLMLDRVTPGMGPEVGVLWLDVHNPTSWDQFILGAEAQVRPGATSDSLAEPTRWNAPVPLRLPAGATVQVQLQALSYPHDCLIRWDGAAPQWGTVTPGGRRGGDFTLWLKAGSSNGGTGTDVTTTLRLRPEQRAAVLEALRAPCAGAPRLLHHVRSVVRPGRAGPTVTFVLTARLASDGPPGRFAPVTVAAFGGPGRLLRTTVISQSAHALTVRLRWRQGYCDVGGGEWLTYQLQARSADGSAYTYQVPLPVAGLPGVSGHCD